MKIKLEPLPMKGAQKFWRSKVKLSSKEFNKLSDEAKTMAFAVSGIAKGAELDTVFSSLQRAIDDGTSFDEFKKDCAEIFERRGWKGKRSWRVDNIFRTNIQTAYNAGHYKQLMQDKDLFPFWQYSAINDSRTRPTHLAMDGRVWPADQMMWNIWYPPNGYRCRCSVIGLTKNHVAARGLTVEEEDPTNRLIEPIDPGTGNKMPARQMLPDLGFATNPGKNALGQLAPAAGSGSYSATAAAGKGLRKLVSKDISDDMLLPPHQQSGMSEEEYVDLFLAEFGAKRGRAVLFTDAVGEPLVISEELFHDRISGKLKVFRADREVYLKLLADTVKDPAEIRLVTVEQNGKTRICKRYIGVYRKDGEKMGGFVVFDLIGNEWHGTTAFRTKSLAYLEKQRTGKLLYEKK